MKDLQKHVEEALKLVPEYGISRAELFYQYMINQELDREFIDKVLPLLTLSEEKELLDYYGEEYKWDIMKYENCRSTDNPDGYSVQKPLIGGINNPSEHFNLTEIKEDTDLLKKDR